MGGLFGKYPRVGEDPGSACRPVEIDKPLDEVSADDHFRRRW
jgi:hypothetical protein